MENLHNSDSFTDAQKRTVTHFARTFGVAFYNELRNIGRNIQDKLPHPDGYECPSRVELAIHVWLIRVDILRSMSLYVKADEGFHDAEV